jgi:N-acetylglucosaminyl-diphospho-decaprenol L-rhamnosyltransferase
MSLPPAAAGLGAVVVTYRSAAHLEGCFSGLRPILDPGSLAVVDSRSPDDTLERARALWPGGRFHRMEQNLGYAAAVNAGLRLLDTPYVLVLNADTVLDPQGVLRALEWLEVHRDFGMVGARLVGTDGRVQISSFTEPSIGGMLRMYLLRDPREPAPRGTYDGAELVDGVVGAVMLLPRAALERVGPMDEDFFLYCEEVDWCARFRRAGYRIALLPEWRVTHLGGASTATLSVHMDVVSHRSRYLYFFKHGGSGRAEMFRLVLVMTSPVVLGLALVNALIQRISWREALSRVTSHWSAIFRPMPQRPEC